MSLIITTYVPEGIVMASDSRQSISIEGKMPDGKGLSKIDTVNSDNVYKTHLLSRKDKAGKSVFEVGVSSFGRDLLGRVSTASHIRKFAEEKLTDDDDVTTIPKKLVDFFRASFPTADTGFHVAGYKKEAGVSNPYVFHCHVGKNVLSMQSNYVTLSAK